MSSSSRASSVSGAAARPVDSVVLAVATLAGLLYTGAEYTVTGLLGGGTASLAGTGAGGDTAEGALQGSTLQSNVDTTVLEGMGFAG